MSDWKFYVYELYDKLGALQYVGKGSNNRLARQIKIRELDGHEVARFKRESDAYAYEKQRIAEHKPVLNKCVGGNGCRSTIKRERNTKDVLTELIKEIGSRRVSAIMWLMYAPASMRDASKVDKIREVAYG